ncbi:MAG TPA: hypothetical protein VFW25_01575 [Silvibacterium sp.]|nr:hypothetical protein [Silvibacterium sp.]
MKRLSTFAAISLLVAGLGWAQVNGDRLILKDGTYQVITKYQIKGDRVRFFSAERDDWEEIPKDLVDWAATARWKHDYGSAGNADQMVTQTNANDPEQQEVAKIDAEERAARAAELARMPFILPGLRLPDESGVWVLDTYNDRPELAHLTQANGDLNRAYQHSVLPYEAGAQRGARDLIRINGFTAPVELHVNQPVFYVSLDAPKGATEAESIGKPLTVDTRGASSVPDDKHAHSSPESRYVILALQGGKNMRKATAEDVDAILRGGQPVNVTNTTSEILPGGRWMKVTPRNTLAFGQYALVEVLSPRQANLDVWAFGVDPTAGENKGTVGPVEQ